MRLHRRTRRRTLSGRRFRERFRRTVVERLEGRLLLASDLEIVLDPIFDTVGFQPETTQFYEDQGSLGSIFDTGASVVTFSALDQLLMDPFGGGSGIPIKVAGGAEAEGIGGTLTGDVSEPGTVLVDGIHVNVFSGDIFESGSYFDQIQGRGSVASASSATEFVGAEGLNLDDDLYNGFSLVFTSTSLASSGNLGEGRTITDYDGGTRTFTFASGFPAVPQSGDTFHVVVGQGVTAGPLPSRDRFSADAAGLGLSDSSDAYLGRYLVFTSGELAGEAQLIGGYDGATHTFELALPLDQRPAVGDTFDVLVGTGSSAVMSGVQVFVGTFEGSEILPTISGTPMLNATSPVPVGGAVSGSDAGPLPLHPNGLALEVGPQEMMLDLGELLGDFDPFLGDLFAGITLPIPSVQFREPGTLLSATESFYAESAVVDTPAPAADQFVGGGELPGDAEFEDFFVGFHLRFLTGSLAGEMQQVSGYDAVTRTFTFDTPFSEAPGAGDVFELVRVSTEPVAVGLDFVGFDNHLDPGDVMTVSYNPVSNDVTIAQGETTLEDQVFLFDTGAQITTITVDEALTLGFDLDSPEFTMSVQGAAGVVEDLSGFTMDELSLPTLDGGTITFTNVPVFVIDVAEEIQGLLGMNLFNSAAEFLYDPFDPTYDRPTVQMTFFNQRSEVAPEEVDLSELDPLEAALLGSVAELMPGAFEQFVGLREIALPNFGVGVDLDLTAQDGVVREEDGVTVVTVTPGTSIDFTAEVPFAAEFYDSFQVDFAQSDTALSLGAWSTDPVWTTTTDGSLAFPGDSSVSAEGDATLSAILGTFVVEAPMTPGDYLLTADDGAGSTSFTLSGLAEPLAVRDFGDVVIRVQEGPSLAIGDAALVEGADGASTDLELTVTLTGDPSGTVSVDYATVDDSAEAASGDYTSTSGTLEFAPGETQKVITVPVHGDALPETDEAFFVNLSNPAIETGPLVLTPVSDVTAVNEGGDLYFDEFEPLDAVELRTDTSPSQRAFAMEFDLSDVPAGATIDSATLALVETTDAVTFSAYVYAYTGDADGAATLDNPFNVLLTENVGTVGNGSVGTESVDVTSFVQSLVTGGDTYAGFYVEAVLDPYYIHSSEAVAPANRPTLTIEVSATPVTVEIDRAQALAVIRNDDTEISISDRQRAEGDTGQGEAVFVVQLSEPSDLEVTVHYETSNGTATAGSDYEQTSGDLVFGPGETSKAISVAVLGDMRDEPDETFSVELSSPTSATLATSAATGTILDDDTAGVEIVETGGNTEVVEGGTTDTYTVVLTSQPTHNVEIVLQPDVQLGVDPAGPLTFTPTNWDEAQTVTVSAVDDDVAEGPHTGTIAHAAISGDGNYHEIGIDGVTAEIGDNDTAGVVIEESGGTAVLEGGATDTYTVVLTSQPTHDVQITLAPDAQLGVDPAGPLTFTPTNWGEAQTVTVSAVDDNVAEGLHSGTIAHAATSDDGNYDGIGIDGVTAQIGDDDTAGIIVEPTSGLTTTEPGGTDTFTVRLESEPTANVTIDIGSNDTTEGTVSPNSLVFAPDNWHIAQTVTVTGADDDDVVDVAYTVFTDAAVSADSNYSGWDADDVDVVNLDDETADFGDAPSPYPTLRSENGAWHFAVGPTLGVARDREPDGTHSAAASADDDAADDEDGVVFTSALMQGQHPDIDVTVSAPGVLNAWLDMNDDGDWDDAYEQIFTDKDLYAGVNHLHFYVPSAATTTERTFARFRFSSSSGLSYDGPALDGEVEDYAVPIGTPELTLTIDADSIAESAGPAATTATLTRNTGTVGDLVVALASDDPSEANVASTVTIPDGMSSVTFDVDAVDDAIDDGIQTATLTASYYASGSLELDSTFGSGGSVTVGDTMVNALAVQPDGSIVAAGEFVRGETGNYYDFRLLRCDADGSLDPTFGTGGIVTSDLTGGSEQAYAVAVQEDGKIVAAGGDWVVRYNVDGTLDSTFDGDGIAPTTVSWIYHVAIQSDGKIVVGGMDANSDFALARYNSNGTPDASFGTAGIVSTDLWYSTGGPYALSLQTDGKIVVATGTGIQLARYLPSGELDATFGVGGKVTTNLPGLHDTVRDLVIQPDGRIVIVGATGENLLAQPDAALVRYETDGALDTTFGVGGVALHEDLWTLVGVALQPDGEIVAAGYDFSDGGNVARYHADGSFDRLAEPWFGRDNDVAVQPSGGVVVGGRGGWTSGDVVLERFYGTTLVTASDSLLVTDDDTAGVSVEPTSGLTTSEAGDTDTYTVVLASEPTHNVEIALDPDGQLGVDPLGPLTFTPTNWDEAQTVTVTAVDDDVAEGLHSGTVTHTATSDDANYNGIGIDAVTAEIGDDDTAGVAIEESGGTAVLEGGTTDTYTVVLTSQPTHDVQITLDPGGQLGVDPAGPLTFTPTDWDEPQTVTVSAVDDDVAEGLHSGTVTHTATSDDANYNGIGIDAVTAEIGDDDTAGVVIEESGGTAVLEGGTTDTYTVVLTTQPTHDVQITLALDEQLAVDPAGPLTFTPTDWDQAQTVTVWAVDDDVAEGPHAGTIAHTATSEDANYEGIGIDGVTAEIGDDDTAGVAIEESGGTAVLEGGAIDTYTIVLTSQPTHDVRITLGPDGQLGVDPAGPLTFTPTDWDQAQTVTVSAVDDDVAEGPHAGMVTHTATSDDANYDGIGIDGVTAEIGDDDTAGVAIEESGGTAVLEGGTTDTYTVVLTSQPTHDVQITLGPDAQLGVDPAGPLTFTPTNWDEPQTVTVSAVDDDVAEGLHSGTVTHTATSDDANYNGIGIDAVTAEIGDNDAAGVWIEETDGLTEVVEGGATDTYTVVLTQQPTHAVEITVGVDGQLDATPTPLTFTPTDWDQAQTVTVSAVDDDVAEGLHMGTVTHTAASADLLYDGIAVADVTAQIGDNDTAGITVTPTSGLTTTEAAGIAAFMVVLDSEPRASVTIGLGSSDTSEGTVAPASLTFTPGDWSVVQWVTVTGVDDDVDDGDVAYTIVTDAATSGDADYDGLEAADVSLTNTDDDTAGIAVEPTSGLTTTELGGLAVFVVRLESEPTANVTIDVHSSNTDEGTVAPMSLTFTPGDWSVVQWVTVTGVDDDVDDGDASYTIVTEAAASVDGKYDGLNADDVSASNTDDDTAGVEVLKPSGGPAVVEGGATDTYHIVLTSQPTHPVAITVVPDGQLEVAPSLLTFTPDDWNEAQSVIVSAVDDDATEGVHTGSIGHTAASGDPAYDGTAVAGVTAQIGDNDSPPSVGALADDPDPVERGDDLTLTANAVSDPDDDVVGVTFWRDANDNQTLDGSDEELGTDTDPTGGWSVVVSTMSFPLGQATYFAQATDGGGRTSNVVSAEGTVERTVELSGTDGPDTITFTTGENHVVWINEDQYVYDPAQVSAIDIDAGEGDDSITIVGGAEDETAELRVGSVDVLGATYRVHADSVERIVVRAGQSTGDEAYLYDGDDTEDTFVATPEYAKIHGDGFDNRVLGFRRVTATSAAAGTLGTLALDVDVAELRDSTGADLLEATPESAKLKFEGLDDYFVEAVGFHQVHAFASDDGQADTAVFEGQPGQKDRFRAWPTEAKMFGLGFYNRAKGFDEVQASGADSVDVAQLYDSAGADAFDAYADGAAMSYEGGKVARADDFRWLFAYASDDGETDTARLYDTTADLGTSSAAWFKGFDHLSKMYGASFYNRVDDFDQVIASAVGGDDTTKLFDSSGPDVVDAYADQATMSYADGTTVRADDFRWVLAYGSDDGQADTARFYDTTADLGTSYPTWFKAQETISRMYSEPVFYVQAKGFDAVTASAQGDDDTAKLFDSALEDVYRSWSDCGRMEYAEGAIAEAVNFRYLLSYSRSGSDTATFYDETLGGTSHAARFVANADWAKLFSGTFFSRTEGFAEVQAATSDDDLVWLEADPTRVDHLLVPFPGDGDHAAAKAKLWTDRRSIYIDDFHTLTATTSEDSVDEKDVDPTYLDVILEGHWIEAP